MDRIVKVKSTSPCIGLDTGTLCLQIRKVITVTRLVVHEGDEIQFYESDEAEFRRIEGIINGRE